MRLDALGLLCSGLAGQRSYYFLSQILSMLLVFILFIFIKFREINNQWGSPAENFFGFVVGSILKYTYLYLQHMGTSLVSAIGF